jgi:hypothetical protein
MAQGASPDAAATKSADLAADAYASSNGRRRYRDLDASRF